MKPPTQLSALALAAVLASTLAAPAHARAAASLHVSPNPALIYGDRATWITITATLNEGAPQPFQNELLAELRPTSGSGYNYTHLTDPDNNGTYIGKVKFDGFDASPGRWRVETSYTANDASTQPGPTGYFAFKVVTKLTGTAKPTTVRRGKPVKVSGKLSTVGLGGGWAGWSGQWVSVYYRRAGTTTWKYTGRAKTNYDGRYSKAFKPSKSGWWKAVKPGSSLWTRAETKPAYVKVR